jgi:hypothetical protein
MQDSYRGNSLSDDHLQCKTASWILGESRTVPATDLLSGLMNPLSAKTRPKITLRKDARIRVLFNERFCHRFRDMTKGSPDHNFHIGEIFRENYLTSGCEGSPAEHPGQCPQGECQDLNNIRSAGRGIGTV